MPFMNNIYLLSDLITAAVLFAVSHQLADDE